MPWSSNRTRLRRFLRDPSGNIWSDAFLLRAWNDAQREIQRRTGVLTKAEAVQIPPDHEMAYLHDWERAFLYPAPPQAGYCHQALHYYEQGEIVLMAPWEAQTIAGADGSSSDLGPHFTHPWEGFATPTADLVPLRFPRGFSEATLASFDRWPMEFVDKKELQSEDSTWKTRQGRPFQYWRDQALDDVFHLYPLPASVTWREMPDIPPDPEYSCSHAWEDSTDYFTGGGEVFTQAGTETDYVFPWEGMTSYEGTDESGMRGMWLFEQGAAAGTVITAIAGETVNQETGTIADIPGAFSNQDRGAALEVIDLENNVFFIFRAEPTDIENDTDESDFPSFLQKYVEFATLEKAFNADTDGKSDALRDFWAQRKEMGIEVIKRFISKQRSDRNYRLVTPGTGGGRNRRQPRLPDSYPAT